MTAKAINAAALALKKALLERALAGEINHLLGRPPGTAKRASESGQRNGKGVHRPVRIEQPSSESHRRLIEFRTNTRLHAPVVPTYAWRWQTVKSAARQANFHINLASKDWVIGHHRPS
jgi:hypothetical protein